MAQLLTLLLEMFIYYFMPNDSLCSNHDALQLGLQTEGRRTFIILMWVCPFFFSCAIRDKLVCSWLGAQHRVLTWDGDLCKHFQTDLIFPPSWIKAADSHKGDRAMDNNLSAFGTVTDWMSWPCMWAIFSPYDIYFSLFSFLKTRYKMNKMDTITGTLIELFIIYYGLLEKCACFELLNLGRFYSNSDMKASLMLLGTLPKLQADFLISYRPNQ